MTEVCRNIVRSFVEDRTDKDGRVSIKALNKFAQMTGFGAQEPWNNVIKVFLKTSFLPPDFPPSFLPACHPGCKTAGWLCLNKKLGVFLAMSAMFL